MNLSIEHKLPLLMTFLIIAVLALGLLLSRSELTASAERSATERMVRAAQGIASGTEAGVRQRSDEVAAIASRPALARAVRARDSQALRGFLDELRSSDTLLVLEVWDRDGAVLLRDGHPLSRQERLAAFGVSLSRFPLPWTSPDRVAVTPFHAWGDSVYFWRVAPVHEAGGTEAVGYLALQSRVTGAQAGLAMMRDLMGERVTLQLRNDDDVVWAASSGRPSSPPAQRDTTNHAVYHTLSTGERLLAAETPIEGTPWNVVLRVPASVVLAPVNTVLLRFALGGLALATIAAFLAWIIGRRIARPLASMTDAAEAIARGSYDRRVNVTTGDEVERLGTAFNRMAGDIASARDALERRTREAEEARVEAERANRAKADFLAVMSHELRTPLNAISGYAELLKVGIYGKLTPQQDDAVLRIVRNQDHLLSLINNVLSFARIDAGQLTFDIRAVAVRDVVAALDPFVAPMLLARQLTYGVRHDDSAPVVRADEEKLRQVLLNLLANAIKFTPPGGRVGVNYETAGDRVHIRVSDTGIGIPPDRVAAIFDPFVQADRALSRPHDGVGLGLSIGRELARGMGGDLTVVSAVGSGSTFTLTLPSAAPALPPVHRDPLAQASAD